MLVCWYAGMLVCWYAGMLVCWYADMLVSLTRIEAKKCVGYGWHNLIDKIYNFIPPSTHIIGVKEKFGGLRIEAENTNFKTLNFIEDIESESLSLCEICGKDGKTITTQHGWLKTLCSFHNREKTYVNGA